MKTNVMSKIETFIGIVLLMISILGFLFMVIWQLPKQDEVAAQAQPLKVIPPDFFSSDNEVIRQVRQLNVPAGVPVTVDPTNLGRENVFQGF